MQTLNVYLVGGAVRDALLNLPIKDKDFVVVGATQSTMLDAGFTQVGADFPVFLHPKSHHEYALARLERKTGKGYQGFSVDTAGVSLEDDLLRRDLTINAMAIQVVGLFDDTPVGAVIDPYGGQQDLADKLLRHISPAFAEDPLRVLRVARFYARFYAQGFHVHTDTARLMQAIADSGELHHLSRERIWTESVKALGETHAFAYFELLDDLGILVKILPDLALAWQNRTLRTRTFQALSRACTTKNSESHQEKFAIAIKFALLISAFLPTHAPSGTANVAANTTLARTFDALMPPNAVKTLASLFLAHYHTVSGIITGLSLCDTGKSDDTASGRFIDGKTLLALLEHTKAHKDCAMIFALIDAVCHLNDTHAADQHACQDFISHAIAAYHSVGIAQVDKTLTGKAIGDELARLRLVALDALIDMACKLG